MSSYLSIRSYPCYKAMSCRKKNISSEKDFTEHSSLPHGERGLLLGAWGLHSMTGGCVSISPGLDGAEGRLFRANHLQPQGGRSFSSSRSTWFWGISASKWLWSDGGFRFPLKQSSLTPTWKFFAFGERDYRVNFNATQRERFPKS